MASPPYQQTIAAVRALLIEVFDAVDAWFDEPAEVRAFRPQDGGWSVDEVLEHVTLTNHYLLLVIRKGCDRALRRAARGAPVPEGESDLGAAGPDRPAWLLRLGAARAHGSRPAPGRCRRSAR